MTTPLSPPIPPAKCQWVAVLFLALFVLPPTPGTAQEVSLPQPLQVPIVREGKKIGVVTLPSGTKMKVAGRQQNQVTLQYQSFQVAVDVAFLGDQLAPTPPTKGEAESAAQPAKTATPQVAADANVADDLGFSRHIQPILQNHCFSCHSAEKIRGNVRFDQFTDATSILEQRSIWLRTLDVLEFEEMPPDPEKTGFHAQHASALTQWIKENVEAIHENNPLYADPGPAVVRQLTAAEYERSIKAIFGIDFSMLQSVGAADDFAEYIFTNNARSMNMDATSFERFFEAADQVIAQFFSDTDVTLMGGLPVWPKAQWGVMNQRQLQAKAARAALYQVTDKPAESREAAQDILRHISTLAFRRLVSDQRLDPVMKVFDQAITSGFTFEQGLRRAIHPILTSPEFLFRIESRDAATGEKYAEVDSFELATRLSYFLWAAPPDKELLELASTDQLKNEEVIRAQVQRLLSDERAQSLSTLFAAQWTQLHHLEKALPERRYFPKWTDALKTSMHDEVVAFFDHLRTENRPVTDLIHSDYTFANDELAGVYGLQGVKQKELQKVSLPGDSKRGGLLGMGAFLTMTSHTNRTKPTARGKWILDVLYGTPPPPPPANVEALEDQAKEDPELSNLTFREQLDRHASDADCRACHDRIDPLGFALENFNGIGEWREKDGDKPLDNTGSLPSGKKLVGVGDLKQILKEDPKLFTANLVRHLMSYALGRNIIFSDELAVKQITEFTAKNEYRFAALVQGIVDSRQFRLIRTLQYESVTEQANNIK